MGALVGALAFLTAIPASADTIVPFDAEWSGSPFGNSATASAIIDIDVDLIPDYLDNSGGNLLTDGAVTSLTITVNGASTGDGTFTESDFYALDWGTGESVLDLTTQLVGQETFGGPWGGQCDYACAFNLYANNASAPSYGSAAFVLQTADNTGDKLELTSLEPVGAPEPATVATMAATLLILYVARRKRVQAAR